MLENRQNSLDDSMNAAETGQAFGSSGLALAVCNRALR